MVNGEQWESTEEKIYTNDAAIYSLLIKIDSLSIDRESKSQMNYDIGIRWEFAVNQQK